MTPKQQRFVEEYLVDLNATEAAKRAGYSAKTAYATGYENLRKPEIAEAIKDAQGQLSERTEITQDWVIGNLRDVAERCMQAQPVRYKNGERVMVETEEGEMVPAYTFQSSGANRALELLGKHLGMFMERHEHSGRDGGPIPVQFIAPEQYNEDEWASEPPSE